VLQLNIRTSIGLGASVNIRRALIFLARSTPRSTLRTSLLTSLLSNGATGKLIAVSSLAIEGGSVAWNVSWSTVSRVTQKHWHDDGCAYEFPAPIDSCGKGSSYLNCTTRKDCCQGSPVGCPGGLPGTCKGVHTDCKNGICTAGMPGGEACGHMVSTPELELVGTDLRLLKLPKTVVLDVSMGGGSDLYSTEFIC